MIPRTAARRAWIHAVALSGIACLGAAILLLRSRGEETSPAPITSEPESAALALEQMSTDLDAALSGTEPNRDVPQADPGALVGRLLEALRSGDRDRIARVLAEIRAELMPEPVPDDENAALVYVQAFKKLSKQSDSEFQAWCDGEDRGAPTPEERILLEGFLERNKEALALLHEAASLPRCNFEIDFRKGLGSERPEWNPLISASKLLDLESFIREEDPRLESVRASWQLGEALATEPSLMSQLVRNVCQHQSLEVLRKALAREPSPEALRDVYDRIDPVGVRGDLQRCLLFELSSAVGLLTDPTPPENPYLKGLRSPRDPLSLHDLTYFAESVAEYMELSKRPYHEIRGEIKGLINSRIDGAPWYADYTRKLLPSVSRSAEFYASLEATKGLSKLGAALGQHRIREESYPSSLEELKPYFPDLPEIDPFSGRPYRYRREGSGFVLYTVGHDGADGGGSYITDRVLSHTGR